MSEVENSTTDIDNNVQLTPTQTPRKRMSRAEKARIESEQLLKSLGVSMEAGRQTRSSRRGTAVESPKPEPQPPKRKQTSTPRGSKKAKVTEVDQTDSTNHVLNESVTNETEAVELSTKNSNASEKVDQNADKATAETQIVPNNNVNNDDDDEQMEVDIPAESTEPESETQPQPESVPISDESATTTTSQADESLPVADQADETLPADSQAEEPQPTVSQSEEVSLPTASQADEPQAVPDNAEIVPPKVADEPEVLQIDDEPVVADTTTIVIDSEPIVSEAPPPAVVAQSSNGETEPIIDLDATPQEGSVKKSQANAAEPEAIVDLDGSSNEGDSKIGSGNRGQERDSLDLEIINSDSSHSANEVQVVEQSPIDEPVEEQSLPTSTQVTITEIIDSPPTNNSNDITEISEVQSSEPSQNAVESTNNATPIEAPEKLCTLTVESPADETITPTSTSETLIEPNATTV